MLSDEEILKLIMHHAPERGRILDIWCESGNVSLALAKETENRKIHGGATPDKLIGGDEIITKLLKREGIKIITEDDL